jgi:hypothetical protein
MTSTPHQPSGPGATGGLPGSGSDTPDGTGFADGSTLGADETASTIDEAGVAPPSGSDTDEDGQRL